LPVNHAASVHRDAAWRRAAVRSSSIRGNLALCDSFLGDDRTVFVPSTALMSGREAFFGTIVIRRRAAILPDCSVGQPSGSARQGLPALASCSGML